MRLVLANFQIAILFEPAMPWLRTNTSACSQARPVGDKGLGQLVVFRDIEMVDTEKMIDRC